MTAVVKGASMTLEPGLLGDADRGGEKQVCRFQAMSKWKLGTAEAEALVYAEGVGTGLGTTGAWI